VHALGFAALAGALLGAAALLPLDRPPLSLFACPLKAATGWPCLFCGCTHAFAHVVRGELLSALAASPLGALLALLCVGHLMMTLLRLCGLRYAPPPFALTARLRWAALGAIALNWIFLAARTRGAL
jgi:hypothetical protein